MNEGFQNYLLGTTGLLTGVLEVEPVTLHRNPFMYTVGIMSEGDAERL